MGKWARVAVAFIALCAALAAAKPVEAERRERPEEPARSAAEQPPDVVAPDANLAASSEVRAVADPTPPPAPAGDGVLLAGQAPAPAARIRLPPTAQRGLRRRFTRIDAGTVANLVADVTAADVLTSEARSGRRPALPARPLTIELFDGQRRTFTPRGATLSYPALIAADGTATTPTKPVIEWQGRIGEEGSVTASASIALAADATGAYRLSGTITEGDRSYRVTPIDGNRHVLTEVDLTIDDAPYLHHMPLPEDTTTLAQPKAPAPQASVAAAADNPVVHWVDMMVVLGAGYDLNSAVFVVASLNGALENTGVNFRANLKAVYNAQYGSSGRITQDLGCLQRTTDGCLDGIHDFRRFWGADVVSLLVTYNDGDPACGIAYEPPLGGADYTAFSVASVGGPCDPYVYEHEVGHNLGAGHHPDNTCGRALPAYACGHAVWSSRDVMSYWSTCNSCPIQHQFSNPWVSFLNNSAEPSGIPSQRDNGAALQDLMPWTSNYRSDQPLGSLDSIARRPGVVRVSGWAIDPNVTSAAGVHVYVDPNQGGSGFDLGPATGYRPDVGQAYPAYGSNHGFVADIGFNTAGTHQVCAYAINHPGSPGDNMLIGCRDITLDNSPGGGLQLVERTEHGRVHLTGVSLDPDTTSPTGVHFYAGSQMIGSSVADIPRPDIGAAFPGYGDNHGFDANVTFRPGGTYNFCAYGINVEGTPGGNSLLGCQQLTIEPGGTRTCTQGGTTWSVDYGYTTGAAGPQYRVEGLRRTQGGNTTDAAAMTWELRWDLAPGEFNWPTESQPPASARGYSSSRGTFSVVGNRWLSTLSSPRVVAPDGACQVFIGPFANEGGQPTWPKVAVLGDSLLLQLNDTSFNNDGNYQGYVEGNLNNASILTEVEAHRNGRATQAPGTTGLDGADTYLLDEFRGLNDQGVENFVIALGANDARAIASGSETLSDVQTRQVALINEVKSRADCVVFVTTPDHANDYGSTYPTAAQGLNAVWIFSGAASGDNVHFIDFAAQARTHRRDDSWPWFQQDNLHLNGAGRMVYTSMMIQAADICV